jgi:imidazole glycerol-phosphate synthase subunit HisF
MLLTLEGRRLASAERRQANLPVIEAVAAQVFVPLTVGGGIRSLEDMHAVLEAGAEKISLDSMAVRNPEITARGSGGRSAARTSRGGRSTT